MATAEAKPPGDTGAIASEAELDQVLFGMPAAEYYRQNKVVHDSEFITNTRGIRLFTQSWLPADQKPLGLLFLCHGYANCTNWFMQLSAIRFASEGLAVFGIDYQGHGRSDGLRCSFQSIDHLIEDCINHFRPTRRKEEFKKLPAFLYGESLGGAIAMRIALRNPDQWQGLLLSSPMLQIKDDIKPPWIVIQLLRFAAAIAPDSAIVPTRGDLIRLSVRDPARLEIALKNPNRYAGNPRLGVAFELLRLSDVVTAAIPTLQLPFIVIHGGADKVTDPALSQDLHERAPSRDKTLYIHEPGFHQLLQGEPEGDREVVWEHVLKWLKERVKDV